MKLLKIAALAAPLALMPAPVLAQDDEEAAGPWEVDGEIAAFSDYRFRGVSLSGKNPQLTAELAVSHESGFYAGVWGSNVDLGSGNDELEVDLYGGWTTDLGGLTLDVGALYYWYPGNDGFDYAEIYSSIGTTVAGADLTLGVAYAPSQGALGNTDNIYVYASTEIPLGDSPFSLSGTIGLEDGAFGNSKVDWLVGLNMEVTSGITASVAYVDTARAGTNLGDPTAVVSLAFSF
ncbi:TorF family putative porin [Alteraurantiacibacter palmitatis]|uniref:TorF family putative porin n=1 Tax=Alteraurantiacibacter palmitatis TaxID=2054628 RepID=A0ABV7EAT8_9SPHN